MKKINSLKNDSGIILVTVVILVLVLSIVAIGVMGLNVSQVKTASSVVDTIKAEQLATGLLFQDHQRKIDGTGTTPTSITIGSTTYAINRSETAGSGATPNNANQIQFNISY
ncbi:MAG: hypothetical protein H6754_05445 [Candidatus Omnitrophica bacterium]|nr:hypothetical protein [Candidatus Omnitrophota bacterium]